MSTGTLLLWASVGLPAAMLLLCFSPSQRERVPSLLVLAPLPALGAALLSVGAPEAVAAPLLFGLVLSLDAPGAVLLGACALLWSAAGAYAGAYLRGKPRCGRFGAFWLLTLTGSLGVFLAADLASFYLSFALASLAAYGLVVHEETPRAHRAAGIYLILAVMGEACLLLGLMMAASTAPEGSLLIRDVVAGIADSPRRDATIALLVAGFGLKAGLAPLHLWLPLAHPVAPTPASAVLSGAIVKAGIIGFIRFLPPDVALPGWGEALMTLGFVTAFYAVAMGVRQAHPKTVLAYSTVSQMGLVIATLGTALAAGAAGAAALVVALYAAHHALAKGALFLSVSVVSATGARLLFWVLAPVALLAIGMGGLPLTGGALTKLAIKEPLGEGWPPVLATISAATTTLLMLHLLRRLAASRAKATDAVPRAGLVLPFAVVGLAAVAVPWALHLTLAGGDLDYVLTPAAVTEALLPVLAGAVLFLLLRLVERYLPPVPEGDLVVPLERGVRALVAWRPTLPAPPALPGWGAAVVPVLSAAEAPLRGWAAAGLALLALALAFGVAFLAAA